MRLSNIALYDKNTTDFFDQGLGILSDAISSESTEAVQDNGNITYEMVLKYPIGGVLSDKLKLPNLIRAQESEDPNDFMIFEIYDYDEDDEGEMTVYAQAMPYRVLRLPFNDDSKFPTKYKNIQELMDYAVSRVTGFPSWFKITSDIIVANNLSFDAGNAQFENLGKFLDATLSLIDASVEYKWNRINILESRGRDLSDIVLRDDKNTNGIKITGSYEKIINKVVPIIRNRNETTGEFEDGTHMGSVVTSKDPFKWIPYYAGVTASFDSQEDANNYISSNKLDNPAITVDVTPLMVDEDLTQVHTFDRITAYSTKLKYQDTLQVTTRVFDQLNAEVVSFKMGSIKKDINSTTSYTLSSLASEIARAQNIAGGAARSADGKNKVYFPGSNPTDPSEGDLWFHKIDGKDVGEQYINGEWVTIIKDSMGEEIRSYVDQKMLENNDAMNKLHSDLESNAQIVTDNKQAVDDAMDKVNEDLTKAKTDAESAFQKSDDAVGKAQSAIEASGLASATANSANDAALAAKELATSTSNSFAEVKSQAGTAFEKAKSALEAANGASSTATKASQDVDSINGVIKTFATTETVDSIKGKVDKATSEIETIGGQMKQVYTKTETTNLLTPYATQTWAQNQITASATELSSTMTTVQQQVQNSAVGTNLLTGTAEFSPWSGDRQFFPNGYLGLTFAFEKDSDGDIAWHLSGTANGSGTVGSYSWKLAHAYPSTYAFSVSVKGTFANTTLAGFHVEGSSDITKSINWSSTYSRWVATGNVASGNGKAAVLYFNIKSGDTIDIWVKKYKLEKGSLATDWCPNPADNASVTALSKLSQTVDGFSGTFATKNDLESTESKFKVTADGLNLITAVTGKNGEKVTQVIADVNNIKNTMTGPNGYTTRLQTLEGFQQTATNSISGLQSSQTQLADTLVTTVGTTNLIMNSEAASDLSYWTDTNKSGWYRTSLAESMYNQTTNSFGISREGLTAKTYAFLYSEMVPVSPGTPITAGAKMRIINNIAMPNDFDYAGIGVRFYDKNKAAIDDVVKTKNATGASLGKPWFQMKIENFVAPDTAEYVSLYFQSAGNGHIFFAQPQLSKSTTLPIYTPGSLDASQLTIMQGLIDARVTVDGKIAAALNLSADGGGTVTIRGASLYVTADSHFDNASINSAAIASLDATKITSGSIAAERLATTKLNADNITSGSIAAERLATTKLNADNITSGSINADLITTGTLSADRIWGGTLNGYLMDIVNINANSITAGTISGANLAINLTTGKVVFQSGRINSSSNNIDINIDKGYMSVADSSNRVLLKGGQIQFIQPTLFDTQTSPYLSISNKGSGSNWAGATIVGRDSVIIANSKNLGSSILTWELGQNDFAGLMVGKNANGDYEPTLIGGAIRGVIIVGGLATNAGSTVSYTPRIVVGSNVDGSYIGSRVYVGASTFTAPCIYNTTGSTSPNVYVTASGTLQRSTSATKYKTSIERSRSTEMGETLIQLPTAKWLDKAEMARYASGEQTTPPKFNFGMIAEDLAAAGLEELVQRGDDGDLEGINYDRIAPALLPLLAQMKQEIEELKGE